MPLIKSKYSSENLMYMPSLTQIKQKIISDTQEHNSIQPLKKGWLKAGFSILLLTGCRISELLLLRQKDFVFINSINQEVKPLNDCSNFSYIKVFLVTKKRRKKMFRVVPLIVSDFSLPLIKFIVFYYNQLNPNFPEDNLFGIVSQRTFRLYTKKLDSDFYPHLIRHIAVTGDIVNGMNVSVCKEKYGWASISMLNTYVSVHPMLLVEQQRKVYSSIGREEVVVEEKEEQLEKQVNTAINSSVKGVLVQKKGIDYKENDIKIVL